MERIYPNVAESSDNHIPKERYMELVHFCRQYPQWRKDGNAEKMRLVEQAAIAADAENYRYLLRGVCYGETYEYLSLVREMPLKRDAYFKTRRRMFFLLDKTRK